MHNFIKYLPATACLFLTSVNPSYGAYYHPSLDVTFNNSVSELGAGWGVATVDDVQNLFTGPVFEYNIWSPQVSSEFIFTANSLISQ